MPWSPRFAVAAFMALLTVSLQFAYIFRASVVIAKAQTAMAPLVRNDCLASGKGGKPLGSSRDCGAGQGPVCSAAEPCTPCAAGGCIACSASYLGDCGFLPGKGPYCLGANGLVGACSKCCD